MDWTDKEEAEYQAIVDQLRRQGWDRMDAMEEADIKMSERIKKRKAASLGRWVSMHSGA